MKEKEVVTVDDLVLSDPAKLTVEILGNTGHAFAIPWTHDDKRLFSGFLSSRVMAQGGPWMDTSPFSEAEARKCRMLYESNGGSSTYRDAFSAKSKSSEDHLSFKGALSVGPPFLSGEVSGKYDKTVTENRNSTMSSCNASYHMGAIKAHQFPGLSKEAMELLKSPGGRDKFRLRYGDYFVYGYTIGADAGICLSAEAHSKESKESLKIAVTVKLLLWSKTVEHTEQKRDVDVSASLSVCGYSTLRGTNDQLRTESGSWADQVLIRGVAATYMPLVPALEKDVRRVTQELKLEDYAELDPSAALKLCKSGVVVQLLLFPFELTEHYLALLPLIKA